MPAWRAEARHPAPQHFALRAAVCILARHKYVLHVICSAEEGIMQAKKQQSGAGGGRLRRVVPSPSMADQARDRIREAIFEGKIKPEERLIIERIAAEIGSSRTPV